jgi:extracellular matrix protein 14
MRSSSSTFAVLNLLLLASSFTTAAPHEALSQGHGLASTSHNNPPRPWRKLSDAIIRRIWRLPEKDASLKANNGETEADGRSLAQYGEDIVLRFNISTAEEASALAEAADILFLDVWEFNDNWVDIRIAKGVVRRNDATNTKCLR